MEYGNVHHKKYNGHSTKQRIRIPKGHLNITHYREKVHMLSILLQGFFYEGSCESYGAQQNP